MPNQNKPTKYLEITHSETKNLKKKNGKSLLKDTKKVEWLQRYTVSLNDICVFLKQQIQYSLDQKANRTFYKNVTLNFTWGEHEQEGVPPQNNKEKAKTGGLDFSDIKMTLSF